jgi:thiol:disulfide interchange protein
VNSRRIASLFLLLFLLMGPGCYAEDPRASNVPSLASTSAKVSATGQWSEGWYQGASGYDQAVEEYKRTNKPMVVYMTAAWCPFCRRFEKEVLSSPLVVDMLQDKIKVFISPDSGSREDAIAFQYRIRGYPSFFLHPPQPGRAVRIPTGVTPEMFIEFFKQVLE